MAASEAFSSATATRPDARRAEPVGHRQHTGHCAHRAVEGQLADEPVAVDPERTVAEAEDGHGDAEVEARALLGYLRRGQVDGEPAGGELETGVADGGAHTLPRLLDGPVSQADDGEVGQAVGDVCLDHHGDTGEAVNAAGDGAGEHPQDCSTAELYGYARRAHARMVEPVSYTHLT